MNHDDIDDRSGRRTTRTAVTAGRSATRLRLVASRDATVRTIPRVQGNGEHGRLWSVPALAGAAVALSSGSYDIRFTSKRRPGATKDRQEPGHNERRPEGRHQEGTIMKAFERLVGMAGRFAVGFGSGLALVCAFVIVTNDVGGSPKPVRAEDVVHLDPVVVRISPERFAEIRAELDGAPVIVRTAERGEVQG